MPPSAKIEKSLPFPKGYEPALKKAGDATGLQHIDFLNGSYLENSVSTGSVSMDLIHGGGFPTGRIVLLYGPEQSGKSTEMLHIIRNTVLMPMLRGMSWVVPVHHYDHESSQDPKYMSGVGIDIRSQAFRRVYKYYIPDTAEQSFRHMARVLRGLPDSETLQVIFIVDSIAAMNPEKFEEDDESGQQSQLPQALSKMFPLVKGKIARKGALLLMTNQVRVNPRQMFGNPEYAPGGNAPRHNADIRTHMRAVSNPYESTGKIVKERHAGVSRRYRYVNITNEKHKGFPPYYDCRTRIEFGRGFDPIFDAVQFLELTGQVERLGKSKRRDKNAEKGAKKSTEFRFNWDGRLKGFPPKGTVLSFTQIAPHAEKIRELARAQMKSNEAFDMLFARQNS